MGTTVYLFTLQFPYGKGEAFLESELPFLAKAFDKVVLVPRDKGTELRELPDNVVVDDLFSGLIPNGISMVGSLMRSLLDFSIYYELLTNPVLFKKRKSLTALFYYSVVKRVISKWLDTVSIDHQTLFYTYWIDSYTYGLCADQRLDNHVIVSRTHRFDLYQDIGHALPYRVKIFNRVNKVFAIAQDGVDYLIRNFRELYNKVELARLGVFDAICKTVSSTDGIFRVVSCSSFLSQKRVAYIAHCLIHFAKSYNGEVVWIHIGDGDERLDVESSLVESAPLNLKGVFLGSIPNQEVIAYYRNSPVDVLINLSSSEGIPVSIMEAQCCSIPVVATDVGGVSEIVDANNGVLLDANPSLQEVTEALQIFAPKNEVTNVSKFKDQARSTWQEKYDAENNYAEFIKRLKSLN